jgi:hypothetical protein
MMMTMGLYRRHWLLTTVVVLVLVLAAGVGLFALFADDLVKTRLRPATIRLLSERFDSDVDLQDMTVRVFPALSVHVARVSLRHRGRTDIPPLLKIASMTMETGIWKLRRSQIDRIHISGLEIVIPPERGAGLPSLNGAKSDASSSPAAPSDSSSSNGRPDAFIGELLSEDAKLTIMPKTENKAPREFAIHRLHMESLQFSRPTPFEATLTNPIPAGEINVVGTFGPWAGEEPGQTPITGDYTFNADLGTIKGIAGKLAANGSMTGVLSRIDTSGTTSTPDFRVTALNGNALPLLTTYTAVVDGTNGDVILNRVDAKLGESTFATSGAIVGRKGVKGRFIRLDIHGKPARLTDIFLLSMKGKAPAMTGKLELDARMDLHPGEGDVVERMTLDGRFRIEAARFTNDTVQGKIDELARRGSGRPQDEGIDDVMSGMQGQFTLGKGVLRLPSVTFSVTGARVAMAGVYNMKSEALDFHGDVRLAASASQTMTGFKSLLLKPFDGLLRKRGAGTRLAIKVTGTRDKPEFGLELGRTFRGQ